MIQFACASTFSVDFCCIIIIIIYYNIKNYYIINYYYVLLQLSLWIDLLPSVSLSNSQKRFVLSGAPQRFGGIDARNTKRLAESRTLDVLHLERGLVAVELELFALGGRHVSHWLHHRPWGSSLGQCDGRLIQWRNCSHRLQRLLRERQKLEGKWFSVEV